MKITEFIDKLNASPKSVEFSELMDVIDTYYSFTETAFTNGSLKNKAGENSGSCKLFAFAEKQGLTQQQTLACFGAYYREDVLENPESDNHQNIRNFMQTGWDGIEFSGEVLRSL